MSTLASFLSRMSVPHIVVSAETLPEFITVDGKERPTKNSEGKLIYPTLEGIENFWLWFGESAVVDTTGRPLIVYHGTGDAGDFDEFQRDKIGTNHVQSGSPELGGFFFTDKRRLAFKGDVIKDVYLKIDNPHSTELTDRYGTEVDYYNATDMFDLNHTAFLEKAVEGNMDGVIIKTPRGSLYVCFEPNQIKSATGNNGSFSPASNKITASYTTGIGKSAALQP